MKKIALSILTLLAACVTAHAQDGTSFEVAAPTVVETGVWFRVEFVLNNPPDLEDFRIIQEPVFDGFDVQAGPLSASGYNLFQDLITGETKRLTAVTTTYVIQGASPGLHTISAAKVFSGGREFTSKPVTIEVVGEGAGAAAQGATQGQSGGGGQSAEISETEAFIRATANRTDVYKGEPVVVTWKFYRRVDAGMRDLKLPTFNGFWMLDISPSEPMWEREQYNNRMYETIVVGEYLLYPQQSGTLVIEPFEAIATKLYREATTARNIFDQLMSGGGEVREVTKPVATQPVRIEVRELPTEGRPDNFDGAVGQFRLEATPPPSAMNANASATYTLRLSGTGNFSLIRVPKLTLPQSFEQYNATTSDNTRNTRSGTSGYREFSYQFIPRSDGLYPIPAFEFSYFDPQRRSYETLRSNEISIEVAADSTAVAAAGGGMMSGVGREDLRVFGEDIRFIKRGGAALRPVGRVFMFSPLWWGLVGFLAVLFVAGFLILPHYLRNMQSDRFVRGKRANKVALRRFRTAESSMKHDDRHGFHDEMLKALWGYMSDKFDIPTADLTKDRIREELFERNVPEAQSIEYVRIISECEEAQYSPVSSSRMGELYREGVALVSELESTIKKR
jgi:hypothetical protein